MSKVTPPMRTGFSRCPEHQHGPLLSCSPCQPALRNDSASDEVSVEAAGPKPSVVAAQRSRRRRGRTARLGGVGEEHLAGIGRKAADDRVVDELDAGAVDLDVGGGLPDTNSSLRVDSSPMRSERRRS